eukprot:scaffold103350_cov65-Phaeocystis_antarctica.AAC.6
MQLHMSGELSVGICLGGQQLLHASDVPVTATAAEGGEGMPIDGEWLARIGVRVEEHLQNAHSCPLCYWFDGRYVANCLRGPSEVIARVEEGRDPHSIFEVHRSFGVQQKLDALYLPTAAADSQRCRDPTVNVVNVHAHLFEAALGDGYCGVADHARQEEPIARAANLIVDPDEHHVQRLDPNLLTRADDVDGMATLSLHRRQLDLLAVEIGTLHKAVRHEDAGRVLSHKATPEAFEGVETRPAAGRPQHFELQAAGSALRQKLPHVVAIRHISLDLQDPIFRLEPSKLRVRAGQDSCNLTGAPKSGEPDGYPLRHGQHDLKGFGHPGVQNP